MYNPDYKQYIFRQSSGKTCNIYYDDQLGLCCSILSKRNTWAEPVVLHKNIHKNFYADIGQDDIIYILFQDKQGNIFMTLLKDTDDMKTIPVLNSKLPTCYNKYLFLIPLRKITHLFYALKHNNNIILAHQTLSEATLSNPKVVDYIMGSQYPYSIINDSSGNMYAFYQSYDDKYPHLGYKKYLSAQKFWSEFIPITKYNNDCKYPRAIIDRYDIIHICYQSKSNDIYELIYQQKVPDKNIWTDEAVIHKSQYSFDNCSIVCYDDTITIFWVRNDTIYFSSSSDNGILWSKPSKYSFQAGRQLMCMSYKCNSSYENENIYARDIPGSFVNGYKLAFLQKHAESTENLSSQDLKTMIVDSLKMLKGNIEDLWEANAKTNDSISDLNRMQQNLEKELTKLLVKTSYLENELSQLNSISTQLENLSNSINNPALMPKFSQNNVAVLKEEIISEIMNSSPIKHLREELDTLHARIDALNAQNKKKFKLNKNLKRKKYRV